MLKIYHNPNCSKSCQALDMLKSSSIDFQIILYVKVGWSKETLETLIQKSGGDIHTILRLTDKHYKAEDLSNANVEKCIRVALQNPTIIERPLIETNTTVFVARPLKKLLDIL